MRRVRLAGAATVAPLVAVLVLLVAGTTIPTASAATPPTASAPAPADAQGVVYPLTSFGDWAQNPANDLTNEALGEYALEQELDQAQSAVLTQDPQALGDALSGPNAAVDAEAYSEQMAAELTHLRPVVAGDDVTNMANPDFMPDFDHNGVFGDPGDFTAMEQGHATGAFLSPCIDDAGNVTYETSSGTCAAAGTPGDTFLTGEAEQQTIIDSRGLALAATLWLPAQALERGGAAHRFPAVVISDGIASDQSDYFWLAMSIAAQGDIVLTYDPAGQGASEGSAANLFEPSTDDCTFGGACRDLEDVVRWLLHSPITPIVNLSESTPMAPDTTSGDAPTPQPESATTDNPDMHDPAYVPQGENDTDPALNLINPAEVAVVGHSMGALSLLNYLWWQRQGPDGADGEPLPPLATGIALSGAAPTAAIVPIQFQTSDYDGSPTLLGPEVGGVDLGFSGGGIGYAQMKPLYDQLRTSGPGTSALSLIVLEGGVHTDFIDTPYITRTEWSLSVSAHYAAAWLDCYLQGNARSCLSAVTAVPHLSTSYASEAAASSGPLPHASRCITVPTTASLSESPEQFGDALAGHPDYTCTP
jgi:hypothetical protein